MTATRTIPLMQPYVTDAMRAAVARTLNTRWIGQGPGVEEFERRFSERVNGRACVAVSSCTAALHLAYLLAGIQPGDTVLAPLFTCSATNIALLHCGAKIRFVDVAPGSLNMDMEAVAKVLTPHTKALVTVHYGGQPLDIPALSMVIHPNTWLIEDCAQSLGASMAPLNPDCFNVFSCYSFQAVKHITTADGGMLVMPPRLEEGCRYCSYDPREEERGCCGTDAALLAKAKRMRWFGIDREAKLNGTWANDITEVGYKYQMTDIGASMGLAGLDTLDAQIAHRRALRYAYARGLAGVDGIRLIDTDPESACWLCTVAVERREDFRRKLNTAGVESDQVHYRNDRYSIFREFVKGCEFPNMDAIDPKYLVIPMHMGMEIEDVERVCEVIRSGW